MSDNNNLGIVGSSAWGPMTPPKRIEPPPMRFGERVLSLIGNGIASVGGAIEWLGNRVAYYGERRVNRIAWERMSEAFGPVYVRVTDGTQVSLREEQQ